MNKFLMLVVLVLLVLASAVGLRNLTANQTIGQEVANTSNPVPVMPDNLAMNTSNPVPVMPDGR